LMDILALFLAFRTFLPISMSRFLFMIGKQSHPVPCP
jgi:hypothetical protein